MAREDRLDSRRDGAAECVSGKALAAAVVEQVRTRQSVMDGRRFLRRRSAEPQRHPDLGRCEIEDAAGAPAVLIVTDQGARAVRRQVVLPVPDPESRLETG